MHTYRESMERQRLLVVTELHDTVVRDLTHAVMTAEQARLAHPQDAALAPELDAMTVAVRAAVEQMRHALRAMSDIRGGERLDIEATSAPRPLEAVIADAAAILGQRGSRLEVQGLELLGIPVIPPGVRLQLLRVLGELVSGRRRRMGGRRRAGQRCADQWHRWLGSLLLGPGPGGGSAPRGGAGRQPEREPGRGPLDHGLQRPLPGGLLKGPPPWADTSPFLHYSPDTRLARRRSPDTRPTPHRGPGIRPSTAP